MLFVIILRNMLFRDGIPWRWRAFMSSEKSAIRDLKKGTGSDRGHLNEKRSNALCQKVGICYFFVVVKGTPAPGLAISTDMCGKCAPITAVSHKMVSTRNRKNHNSSRQDEVALISVIQSAELKKLYTLGDLLQKILEFYNSALQKY